MATMVPDCPLDAEVLHRKATAETGGLTDFGAQDYRERLDVFLAAVRDISGLSEPGIVNFHLQVLQLLKNRLLLVDLLGRHPEIHDVELLPPVVIAGLPRTGTTHLHNLLASGGTFRVLRYWESVEPFPLPAEAGPRPRPADRAHRPGRVVHEPRDAALPADARDDDRARARGDPAAGQRLLQHAAGDGRTRAGLAGPLPRARPDAALRAPAAAAQGPAVPARRPSVAAEVAAAPRAAAGAQPGLPGADDRGHPPRPAPGAGLDGRR